MINTIIKIRIGNTGTVINGISNIIVANPSITALVLNVILLFLLKDSKLFLYNFVDLNQLFNLSDPFIKQKDAISKNGVVGNMGNIIPITPIIVNKNPKIINIAFI